MQVSVAGDAPTALHCRSTVEDTQEGTPHGPRMRFQPFQPSTALKRAPWRVLPSAHLQPSAALEGSLHQDDTAPGASRGLPYALRATAATVYPSTLGHTGPGLHPCAHSGARTETQPLRSNCADDLAGEPAVRASAEQEPNPAQMAPARSSTTFQVARHDSAAERGQQGSPWGLAHCQQQAVAPTQIGSSIQVSHTQGPCTVKLSLALCNTCCRHASSLIISACRELGQITKTLL